MSSSPLRIADRLAAALIEEGAQAVALVGSYATGTATADSDLDLAIVGNGPSYRLEVHEGILVSFGRATAEEQRERLYDPEWLGTHVPGWRSAVLLRDPYEIAAELQQLANDWEWEQVAPECDRWVAGWIVGLAEEVQKLVSSALAGNDLGAAAQRSVIALRLPRVLAIHRRILYASENPLWELVAVELGLEWRQAQLSALGLADDTVEVTFRSALRLFEIAVDEVRELLDERQLAVVERALDQRGRI
jgi:predicted nucleotidyltransferase